MEELKDIPLDAITAITQQYQQKLMAKINRFVKILPDNIKKMAVTNMAKAQGQPVVVNTNENEEIVEEPEMNMDVEDAFDLASVLSADSALQLRNFNNDKELRRQSIRDAQQAIRNKNRNMQLQKKQLEAMAEEQKLHLGLLTDDRDTTLMKAQKSMAQAKHRNNWSFNFKMPKLPIVQLNNKYVVTVSDKNVTFTTDDNQTETPVNFQIDKTKLDVHHEKQVKNGKEEEIVVISINSLK
jgi:hypothetical protein